MQDAPPVPRDRTTDPPGVRPLESGPDPASGGVGPILVQKFGGTSVGDIERLKRCATRAVHAWQQGRSVVVIVSAMGSSTDDLLELAASASDAPPQPHLDLLLATGEQASAALMAMAIEELGVSALPLAGPRIGIVTDPVHCNAKIRTIDVERIRAALSARTIVVCAGFQGVDPDGAITTLGRGGSDTTAVAIAAALGVSSQHGDCEIRTDVDGVYTADPRIVPGARRIERIVCEEMIELASLGAGVLHPRAALFAQRYDVPLHVRHSGHDGPGTMVVREDTAMERESVVGCALTRRLGRLAIRDMPNRPGAQARLFEAIAAAGVLVDDIIQNEQGDRAEVAFTTDAASMFAVERAVRAVLDELGGGSISVESDLCKVSAVGAGMRTHTGVASRMFTAIGEAGIVIRNITTSEIKISCLVSESDGERALRAVHETFELGRGESIEGVPSIEVTPRERHSGE